MRLLFQFLSFELYAYSSMDLAPKWLCFMLKPQIKKSYYRKLRISVIWLKNDTTNQRVWYFYKNTPSVSRHFPSLAGSGHGIYIGRSSDLKIQIITSTQFWVFPTKVSDIFQNGFFLTAAGLFRIFTWFPFNSQLSETNFRKYSIEL